LGELATPQIEIPANGLLAVGVCHASIWKLELFLGVLDFLDHVRVFDGRFVVLLVTLHI